jgi:hypothetical protein
MHAELVARCCCWCCRWWLLTCLPSRAQRHNAWTSSDVLLPLLHLLRLMLQVLLWSVLYPLDRLCKCLLLWDPVFLGDDAGTTSVTGPAKVAVSASAILGRSRYVQDQGVLADYCICYQSGGLGSPLDVGPALLRIQETGVPTTSFTSE